MSQRKFVILSHITLLVQILKVINFNNYKFTKKKCKCFIKTMPVKRTSMIPYTLICRCKRTDGWPNYIQNDVNVSPSKSHNRPLRPQCFITRYVKLGKSLRDLPQSNSVRMIYSIAESISAWNFLGRAYQSESIIFPLSLSLSFEGVYFSCLCVWGLLA